MADNNNGLYLGAALLGLGGAYLLSQSDSESGGGLGETIREQIESVVAIPQVYSSRVSKLIETVTDLPTNISDIDLPNYDFPGFDLSNLFPTNAEINTAAADVGSYAGEGIGGALGSAFLNGFTGMYKGAMVAGAQFAGRNDVNSDNVISEFTESLGYLKNTSLSAIYEGVPKSAGFLLKGLVMGGDAGDAARYLSGSRNNSTNNVSGLITGVISPTANSSRNRSGGGADGSARLAAFRNATSNLSSKAVENTAGINKITRTLKKEAGVA